MELRIGIRPVFSHDIYRSDKVRRQDGKIAPGSMYGRILKIGHSSTGENGTLIATFQRSTPSHSEFPENLGGYGIYASLDGGRSWRRRSVATDPSESSAKAIWSPHLFELPRSAAGMPSGTLLLAGISVDRGPTMTVLQLYRSFDSGHSWRFVTTIDRGGGCGEGLCEPYLDLMDDDALICHYSDETLFNTFSQKLVYRTSHDALRWSSVRDSVASARPADRPGMAVVTRLGDGRYFMVYEVCDRDVPGCGNTVTCRYSPDGLDWGDPRDIGRKVRSSDGACLGSSPYCGWTPYGGGKGTLIVSGAFLTNGVTDTGSDYFLSHDYGETWYRVPHPIPYSQEDHSSHNGYSNSFFIAEDGQTIYSICNRGTAGGQTAMTMAVSRLEIANRRNT